MEPQASEARGPEAAASQEDLRLGDSYWVVRVSKTSFWRNPSCVYIPPANFDPHQPERRARAGLFSLFVFARVFFLFRWMPQRPCCLSVLVRAAGHEFKACLCTQVHMYVLGLALTLPGAGGRALPQPHFDMAGLGVLVLLASGLGNL